MERICKWAIILPLITPPEQAKAINEIIPGHFDCSRGNQYLKGDIKANIQVDYKKALEYFSKAASLKNAEGYYNLALMYSKGLGVQEDISKSLSFLKLAAQQSPTLPNFLNVKRMGVVEAEFTLGLYYYEGTGVTKNISTAIM